MIYARLLVHGAPEAGAGDPDQSPPGKMHQNIRIILNDSLSLLLLIKTFLLLVPGRLEIENLV